MIDPGLYVIYCPICSEPAERQEGRLWRFQCATPECLTRFMLQRPEEAARALAHREAQADAARKRETRGCRRISTRRRRCDSIPRKIGLMSSQIITTPANVDNSTVGMTDVCEAALTPTVGNSTVGTADVCEAALTPTAAGSSTVGRTAASVPSVD